MSGNEEVRNVLKKHLHKDVYARIEYLANLAVISDARMLDFLSRKDARVYRHQADCIKDLLRLLATDFPYKATAEGNEVDASIW